MTRGTSARLLTAAMVAGAFSVATYAQDTTRGTQQAAGNSTDRTVTVTGCLKAERDVPGRDESLFQRWGLTERDYVLTSVQGRHGSQHPGHVSQNQPGQAGQAAGQADRPGHAGHAGQADENRPAATGATGQTARSDRAEDQGVAGTAGTSSAAVRPSATNILRLEGKDADELRRYANQRVEIQGEIDDRNWFERVFGGGEDGNRTAGGTAGTERPTGTTGTGTSTAGADDRPRSIEIDSIRPLGSC